MLEPEPLLTDQEVQAMAYTTDLWNQLCCIVGYGPTRNADLAELGGHVHAIQNAVLAQAAARAYPGRFRLMGGTL